MSDLQPFPPTRKRPMKLNTLVTLMVCAIIGSVLLVVFALYSVQITRATRDDVKDTALGIARTLADSPDIKRGLMASPQAGIIQPIAQAVTKRNDLLFTVVTDLRGVRHPHPHALPGRLLAALLPLSGLLGALLLAGLARSAPPQMDALGNSLGLALAACALGAAVCLLWLACGPARGDGWVWLPLVLPALPLADGQYRLALYAWLDGDWWTVLWGHLLWVVPWMLFILRPAWRQRDPRLTVVARTLGWGSTRIFWLLTLPSLTRPLLTALAVGFSVSIAQYLPTLWLGAGRIPTLTSQAVALSSGGEAQTLAAQALWQLLLPAVCFTLTALLAWLAGRYRRGLR